MLYWPGTSWLHRTPVGAKLLALVVAATVITWIDHPAVSAAVLCVVVAITLAAGVPVGVAWRQARPLVAVIVLLAVFQVAIGRPVVGAIVALRLLAVAGVALAVTLTTPFAAMVAWFERVLRRLRVRPDRVFRAGLIVGLALRSIDHLGVVANRVLDARRARGLGRNLRAFAVPTVVAAARFAHGVGEALDARGLADANPGDDA